MSESRRAILLILGMCIAEVCSMLGVFAFPTLLPSFLEIWGLTHTEAGWINGVYFAGYAVTVPVLASLTDHIDARRIYALFAVVGAVATLGFAVFASGFWTALLFRSLGGVGLAGMFIPGLKALVDRLEGTAQARAVSFYTATFSLGTAVSFYATGELNQQFGWRWAFGLSTVGVGVSMVLAMSILQPRPVVTSGRPRRHLLDFRPVLRNRRAMAYILAYAAHMWELFALRSWIVAFLAFSLSLQSDAQDYWMPSTVAAITGLIAMWASVGGAELALRLGRDRVLTIIMGSSALFACGVGFTAGLPYPLVALLIVVYAMLVQGDSAALHTGAVQTADPDRRGATMAVQSLLGFVSAFVAPLAIGVVLDMTGGGRTEAPWGAGFIAMAAVAALGPVLLKVLGRAATSPV